MKITTDTACAAKIAEAGRIYEDLAAYAHSIGGEPFIASAREGIPAPGIEISGNTAFITARFSFPVACPSQDTAQSSRQEKGTAL